MATLREIVGGVPPPVNACGWIVRPTRIRSAAAGAIAETLSGKVARLLRADRCGAPDPTRRTDLVDEPTATETGTTEDVLSVYLAKYGSLRAETASRFQFQAQAYNFLVVVLTAAVVAAASLLGSGHAAQFERLILVLPLVAGPLGYLYLSNDLMIFGIAGYLDRELSRDVSALVGRDIVLTRRASRRT